VAIVGLAVVIAIPFAVMGPKFILDDWFTLFWRRFEGILWTAGHGQLRARPGAWLTFLVEFGLIGRHPLAVYALQTALNAALAVLLFRVTRAFISFRLAVATSLVWVVLQDHTSLDHWASTMPSQVSLLLALVGVIALVRSTDRDGYGVLAVVLFVASGLTYEATLPVSALALVAVPWLRGRPVRWRVVACQLVPLVATGLWMLANTQHHEHGWFSFALVYPAHFGWGITPSRPLGLVVGILAAVLLAIAIAGRGLPSLRPPPEATGLALAGLTIIVIGTLAFARDPIDPLALGDRANVVSSVGAAIAWVGMGALLWDWRRPVAVAAAVAFVAMSLTERVSRDVDYARAGRDADRILAAVVQKFPRPPAGVIYVGPSPVYHHGVIGLVGEIQEATQAYTGNRRYRVIVANNAQVFAGVPPELRVTPPL
jgi:hypothetical protein